ncbi:DUF4192 domain-containing protein [Dactylosporangium roseum]|uniref:DUF4192 domain-containing protein n=1 Tax=Dactylosporangium roseum TaxID=47989 RepID=A0ABY5Z474_9ACTN|nr:DUF4192 domain-containing protein [Dactylosporangium roseum]UWZ36863.1 DUF4192 domain-containing protein [Dactylosporangium roseum]
MTTAAASPWLRLSGPAEILSATPYLLGFHPANSLVVLGLHGTGLRFHVRGDLPDDRDDGEVLAEQYGSMFAHHNVDAALLIGYGPAEPTGSFLFATRAAMLRHAIDVPEMLRAHEGRYWSLLCGSAECCPPEGREYDVQTSAAAVEATVAGMVALPDRDTVVRSLAGPEGPALAAIQEATDRAGLRLVRLATGSDVVPAVTSAGTAALAEAVAQYRTGQRLTDDEVAWLTVLLQVLAFRDRAWLRIDRDGPWGRAMHLRLWTDLVRRADPGMVAPAAMLLGYLHWRAGDGLRARIAVDRALDADPGYNGAKLMAEILDRGVPPAELPPLGRSRRRAVRRRKC